MKSIRTRLFATLTVAAAVLCSCASPKLRYEIRGTLNPDPSGDATSLDVVPFFMTEAGRDSFSNTDYDALVAECSEARSNNGRTPGQPMQIPVPKQSTPYYGGLSIQMPEGDFTWLGLVGNFSKKEGDQWRILVPLSELGNHELVIEHHAFAKWQSR